MTQSYFVRKTWQYDKKLLSLPRNKRTLQDINYQTYSTMKKQLFNSALSLSVLSALILSSCQDYIPFDEEQVKAFADGKEYDQHFIERFGVPAEGHTWGKFFLEAGSFGENDMTRAGGSPTQDNVNVNRNQWCERETNGTYKNNANVLINTVKVPGWPNFDGYYYASGGQGALTNIEKHEDIFKNEKLSLQPVGDVTDYEINYVSTWFRTHKNPASIELHLSDFFIQNISQDNDQLTYNDYIDCGGTTIPQGLPGYPKSQSGHSDWWNGDNAQYANDVIDPTTNTKRSGVVPNVSKKSGKENSNENLNYSMDYLHFMSMGGSEYNSSGSWSPDNTWTHINNFNRGNSNFDPEDKTDKGFREIKYVHSSGTEDFACRSSMANQSEWIHDWVLVRLEWDEPGADGTVRHREGYYLAFDFSGSTNDTQINRDGFFSNWIVKITPAYLSTSTTQTARIMCEDLGGSFDFDFNDVVYDVAYDGNKHQAVICVQASGGTLPIKIGNNLSDSYETHYLLGQSEMKPVNVDAGVSHEVAIYRLDVPYTGTDSYVTNDNKLDFYKIPIFVKQNDGDWTDVSDANVNIGTGSGMTSSDYGSTDTNPATPTMKDNASKTPRKFVTRVGVDWMKELQCIDYGYRKFHLWVADPNYSYSDLDTSGSDGNSSGSSVTLYWYDDVTREQYIHKGPKDNKVADGNPNQPVSWNSLLTVKVTEEFDLRDKAVDYITIRQYAGDQNSIIKQLIDGTISNMITFAYITKTPATNGKESVHGLILPIWILEDSEQHKKPYYFTPDGTKTEITQTILEKESAYRPGIWQSSFIRSGTNGETTPSTDKGQGVDNEEKYTFVNKFGYTIDELYVNIDGNEQGTKTYCDYIAFYVYEDRSYTNYNYQGTEGGVVTTSGPVNKYECYYIY